MCPFPARRLSHPARALLPRRLALELAVRTLLETDAPVVGVALPTPRIVAVVLERADLAGIGLSALARTLALTPLGAPSSELARIVDGLTLPRTYLFLGFEPSAGRRVAWAGMPR